MRILYVSQTFPPEPGATQRPLRQAQRLRSLGHDVTVVTTMPYFPTGVTQRPYQGRAVCRETVGGVDVLRVWSMPSSSNRWSSRIASQGSFGLAVLGVAATLDRPDVMIVSVPYFVCDLAVAVAGILRAVPTVLELRDLPPENLVLAGRSDRSLGARAIAYYLRAVCALVDVIAVPGAGMAKALAERGVSPERILLLPHAADPVPHAGDNALRLRSTLGLQDKFVLAYAGSFASYYGVAGLVDAMERLQRRCPKAHLLLIGAGADRAAIAGRLARRGPANVTLLDAVEPDAVRPVVLAADACLAPLLAPRIPAAYQDYLTTKVCEYMFAGRMVIAVEAGDCAARVLEATGAGMVVRPGDPDALADTIEWCVAHPEEVVRRGRRAFAYAQEHLRREVVVDRFERALCKWLSNWRPRRIPWVNAWRR